MTINKREMIAGSIILLIGMAGLFIIYDYNIGTARRMGPGYLPLALSLMLSAVGALIIVTSITALPRNLSNKSFPSVSWRPMTAIFFSLGGFMAGMYLGGLLPAIVLTILISSIADKNSTWTGVIALLITVPFAAWLIFNQGLGLPIPFLELRR
ncbi:tripartite tricarboxylate transporter TctB family protein [Halomonas sp. A29]|uniref:tripartite tricarboxylate transporter TctB family protein n=1 Tax=Halomonas sp. A29 TaxID=3102786 RepID=UPI00398AF81F